VFEKSNKMFTSSNLQMLNELKIPIPDRLFFFFLNDDKIESLSIFKSLKDKNLFLSNIDSYNIQHRDQSTVYYYILVIYLLIQENYYEVYLLKLFYINFHRV
jgi:hypothetical protein